MRILSTILFFSSFNLFSAELLCKLNNFDFKIQTDMEACSARSNKASVISIANGMEIQTIQANCKFQESSQFITNKNMVMFKDIFLELELKSLNSDDSVFITNDQTIGFNKGISTITLGGVEVEFSLMEDCNYIQFVRQFLEIQEQAPAQEMDPNQLIELLKKMGAGQ